MAIQSLTPPFEVGQVFTRLTVLTPGIPMSLCQCNCGNTLFVRNWHLKSGNTRSCGCLNKERVWQSNITHGQSRGGGYTKEYGVWVNMKARILPSYAHPERYYDRGIKVCEGLQTFENFFALLHEKPSQKHSLDRKDNNGHYSCGRCPECLTRQWPMNVRWATSAQQQDNRSVTIWITYQEETRTPRQWASHLGVNFMLIYRRLRDGWSIERALTTPVRHYP